MDTSLPEPPVDLALRQAGAELERLNAQCAAARAALERMRDQLALAELRSEAHPMLLLRDANEALVASALQAQQRVEAREQELGHAMRTLGLDPLTQLPNRLLLRDRFAQAAAGARRHGEKMALLFVDLDRFKRINDLYGHASGDEALCTVAKALVSVVRESDTVARHGGDEFVVLLGRLSDAADAVAIAQKTVEALSTLVDAEGEPLGLSASIGIAIHPDDGEDLDTLIDIADAAMYRNKRTAAPLWPLVDASAPLRAPPGTEHGVPPANLAGVPLREVNERLLMAVLHARDRQLAAENAVTVQQTNLAVTAHELRNPLAPISYALTLLKSVQSREPIVASVQGILERQLAQMIRLVGDLLDVSRASTGKLRIERAEVDVRALVDAAVQATQAAMQRRHQTMALRFTASSLQLHGDAVRLVQVFANLLDNASKYTPDGGSIRFDVVRNADQAVFTVSDSGIGISPEVLPHVFDAFAQEDSAAAFNSDGMGIGLMLVQQLVQAHGGTVVARSRGRDLGSEFVVSLPLAACPVTDP